MSEFATVIRGGTLVLPGEDGGLQTGVGDLLMQGDRIAAVGSTAALERGTRVIYASGCVVLPGFVQTHVHLGHALLRGLADGLGARGWRRQALWPRESLHTPESLRAAARLAVAELLLTGTTAVQAMESGADVASVLQVLDEAGMHAVVGKALMDDPDGAPLQLCQRTDEALGDAVDLAETWDGAGGGRLRVALAPYSLTACTSTLLREVGNLAAAGGWRVQMHAAGDADEVATARARGARGSVHYLRNHGIAGAGVGLASCLHLQEGEAEMLAADGTRVLHCPGADARLGGGIAPVAELRRRAVGLGLGTDGPASNDSFDLFREMRLAGSLQAARHGPGALPAATTLEIATAGGAATLGWSGALGALRVGSVADVVLVSLEGVHTTPCNDVLQAVVHGCGAADIRAVWLGGRQVVAEGQLMLWDEEEVRVEARREAASLLARAGR